MSPIVYEPDDPHRCAPYGSNEWRSLRHGTVWKCPECGKYWRLRDPHALPGCYTPDREWRKVHWWNLLIWDRIIDAQRPARGPLGFDAVDERE